MADQNTPEAKSKAKIPQRTRMGMGKEDDLDDPKSWHYWMAEMGHPRIERLYELRRDLDELKGLVEGMVKILENISSKVVPL